MSDAQAMRHFFYSCMEKAQEEAVNEGDDYVCRVLNTLADACAQTGISEEMAVRLTCFHRRIGSDEILVRRIFNSYYAHRDASTALQSPLSEDEIKTWKAEFFLKSHYLLRRNTLTNTIEISRNDGTEAPFEAFSEAHFNSLLIQAAKEGYSDLEAHLRRFIHSKHIPSFDPICDWLNRLAPWDKRDRINDLARRIATHNPLWEKFFHLWMRQTVCRWTNKPTDNAAWLQPVFVCTQDNAARNFQYYILPPSLRTYLQLAPKQFGDRSATASGQDTNILVTDNPHPIHDSSQLRHWICIAPEKNLRLEDNCNYAQIYAQLKEEIENGKTTSPDNRDIEELCNRNALFQDTTDLQQMILSAFRKPLPGEDAKYMKVGDIIDVLIEEYPSLVITDKMNQETGNLLKKLKFNRKRINTGSAYQVVPRKQHAQPTAVAPADNPLAAALLSGLSKKGGKLGIEN